MTKKNDYLEFLKNKQKKHIQSGFEIEDKELNPKMFDFQKFIVKRALRAGKYAIFADCGLGKTFMQLEWANQVSKKTNKPVLILAPLAVSGQTVSEAKRFNLHCEKLKSEVFGFGVYIINYEQLENIDCNHNKLRSLPILPKKLEILDCSYNNLSSLPILPL